MRLIDADELQQLFNAVSTDLLALPELTKDAEHMVRAFLMVTEMIQDAPTVGYRSNCGAKMEGVAEE